MRCFAFFKAASFAACLLAAPVSAQQQDARADGKAFGESLRDDAQQAAQTQPDAIDLPNYDRRAVRGLEALNDDPDRMESSAAAAAIRHEGYGSVRESITNRARFDSQDIEDVIARSLAINKTPLDYTSGMAVTGSKGACVPLPPGSASAGSYIATCSAGTRIEKLSGQCNVPLIANVIQKQRWHYLCTDIGLEARYPQCSAFESASCQITGYRPGPCLQWFGNGPHRFCSEPSHPITEISCDVPDLLHKPYTISTQRSVDTVLDESQCAGLSDNSDCKLDNEICTDGSLQTRVVNGVSITRPCWAWQRNYSCAARRSANDCFEIEDQGDCRFLREECLTDNTPCETWERIYECPLPDADKVTIQYLCDGDIYCIDGSCETIERTANDEFKDAAAALHAMDEARGAFDAQTLTLFQGKRNTCSSKVFGVLNCCKGKGFPVIPGISLLVALGCDREEVLLHERDAKGLCTYVGTYCSDKFLGVCLTKRKAYCCFESKLARILQEQGRRQLSKPWDKPKEEQCEGFTLDEFAQLDLSQMDFSEVYAEFTEAARLPDELETSILIQQKIEDYYARSGQ